MNFEQSSKVVVCIDIIGSIIIGGLVIFAWLSVDKPIQYIYHPLVKIENMDEDESGLELEQRRKGLEGCVITWCLTILLVLCAWRVVSAAILTLAVQRRVVHLMQYWAVYKCFVFLISTFVFVSSFTSTPIIPSGIIGFVLDLATTCFIPILIPQITVISRGSVKNLI